MKTPLLQAARVVFTLLFTFFLSYSYGQTVYTSNGSGTFRGVSWLPSNPPDFNAISADNFIIRDGDAVILASSISINDLEIGQGGAGATFTIGNDATGRSLTVSGNLTNLNGSTFNVANNSAIHTVTLASDLVHVGSSFNTTSASDEVNFVFNGTATSVISGTGIVFNDLTLSGGSGLLVTSASTVGGDFLATGTGSDITTTQNLIFQGNFTLASDANFTATVSTIFFNGLNPQTIDISGGVANFNSLTFDNSTKTFIGDIIADGTTEVTDDAIVNSTGRDHQIYSLEVKNTAGIGFTGGSVTFTSGEIRFGDDVNTDGVITLGTGVNVVFDGNMFLERDDELVIDGNVEITSDGYLVLNGTTSPAPVGEQDSKLTITGSRSFTIGSGGDLFVRGHDNFPTEFDSYLLDLNSLVRYDADFDQLIRGENSADATINYGRLYLSQAEASPKRSRELFTGDPTLIVRGQYDQVNGVRFTATHAATITFNEDIFMSDGNVALEPNFDAGLSTVILDSNGNQTLDGPVDGNYTVSQFIITNTSIPTTNRIVNIDDNIKINSVFTITNPNGSEANTIIVDLDENQIFGGNGSSEQFNLGANCLIYSSTADAEGFAEDFSDGGDIVNIDPASIIRFDRIGDQAIPNFNGGIFGSIEFSGTGNRFIPFAGFAGVSLTILGDVSRVGGSPVFRFGSLADPFQVPVNHSVAGDWNMATAYTGDNEMANAVITFNGTDQIISASDFGSVVFAGSGTKTITGTQLIDGNLTINDGVIVNAGSEAIDIGGNWTEIGTGLFTQTGSVTDFNGGTIQNITSNADSFFDLVTITNNSTLTINSNFKSIDDLNIASGSSVSMEGRTIRVGGDLWVNTTAAITYTTPSTTTIIFDGATEQNIRNINPAQNFPTLRFEGVGNKEVINNEFTVEGDLTISSEATFNGNSFEINFEGSTWLNEGNFSHNNSVNFLNTATTTVSSSSFHDIEIGMSDGSVAANVLLNGNITLNGEMNIFANSSLDISVGDFSITVEEDWNNYGVFNARNGNVTFTGGRSDFRTFSLTDSNSGTQSEKAFYDLTINIPDEFFLVQRDGLVLNDQIDILNDLNVITGSFWLYEDDGGADPGPGFANIGGGLSVTGNGLIFSQENSRIVMNGTSGTHSIDLGGDQVRDFVINAPGATYQLVNNFQTRDDADNAFEMIDGTLDLNGNILSVNRGGLDMSGGTIVVDEGASLLINDLATNPDFNKTGGTLQVVGIDGNPATLSAIDVGGFTFNQSGGDFQARFYTIANTTGDGIRIEGGTLDGGATGNDFDNGTFTSGSGTAYLTLANISIGTLSASEVIFNAGPTNNVAIDVGSAPTGTIEFVVSGGSLAGPQDELDVPDGGATTGNILWDEDDGLTWIGGTSTAWGLAANWNNVSGDPDGIPDADDIVYIEAGVSFNPVISAGQNFSVARVTIRNSGSITLEGDGVLNSAGNFTVFSGSTLDMSNDPASRLNIAGAWANAGTFNEGMATVTFNGTTGTHSISTSGNSDPFYNLVIDGDGATYTEGSITTVTNSLTISNGTYDASSGFDLFINNGWLVNGGIFNPGQGRVRFNGSSGTQSISGGTLWDVLFEGAAIKSIDGNISMADDVIFSSGTGIVNGNDKTIFVGGDWDLDQPGAFVPGTGTVIFNGTGTQNIENDRNQALTFNDVILQNAGVKNFFFTGTVMGDFSILSEDTFVDFEVGANITIAGTLAQTGGNFRMFDSNFPTATTYNLIGGEVDFLQDGALSIPGGISFNDLEIRTLSGGVFTTTATLGGDITVKDDINVSSGAVTFNINNHTITLGDNFSINNDDFLTWGTGTLIQTGDFWNMDADFNTVERPFENLILSGTNAKRPNSDILVGGNLTVSENVNFQQLTRLVTNDGDGAFTMEANSILDNRVVGVGFPTGFSTYSVDPESRVDLQATGNQTLFTNGGTLAYGQLRLFTSGSVTMDGNLLVEGDFTMNNSPTLEDGGFNFTMNGSISDIRNYNPSIGTTQTFSGNIDQLISDNDGTGLNLDFANVTFGGTGTKTLTPNAADEVTDINGNVIINSGVTVETARGLNFSGTSWLNNGTFNLTVTSRPFVFDGGNATVDPGVNEIAALTVSNSLGTLVTIQDNGFDLGTGTLELTANSAIDFGGLTHNLANSVFTIDPATSWDLTGATLIFDRNTTQILPVIDEANANITGIPSIVTDNAGVKRLSGNTVVDNVTIGNNTDLDVDFTDNYTLTVNGSWQNNGGDFFEREGTVIFNSDNADPKNIDVNGEDFARVIFQGSVVRTYTLLEDMQVEGNTIGEGLSLSSATLELNGKNLTLGDNDPNDPDAELNIIGMNGRLNVDAGATLQFETSDDGGDVSDTEIGGNLDVQSGGVLSIVGSSTDLASVSRTTTFNRIDINIESGGEIEAQFYSIQDLTDEGLEVEDGAIIDLVNNFSNGSFSNLATDAGNGLGGDDNPVAGNRYLTIESDAALTISNVTFNFGGTPTIGNHFNVSRSATAGNNIIDFENTSGPLGRNGSLYEEDGDPTAPANANGVLTWDLPVDSKWIGVTSTDWETASNWDNGVPSIALNDREAIIDIGTPFNPSINGISVNISGLLINDGILKIVNGSTLNLDGDLTLGDGTGGALIMDNTSTITVEGSWTTSTNAIFDNGEGTVAFDAATGSSVSITPGDQSFHNLTFTNPVSAGEFNIITNALDVNGNLLIEGSATVIPSSAAYNYTIAGDITSTNGVFDTNVDGEIILDGADQIITDMIFDELTVSGTATKSTVGTVTINDNFSIELGANFSGGGAVNLNGEVQINGTFTGVDDQIYTFRGVNWFAGPGSYSGTGTVEFKRELGGGQYIRQLVDGDNPVEFNNLTLNGNALIQLGLLVGGDQFDGNVDLTGDLTINNTINTFRINQYQIDNTSGTGIMTLAENEFVRILGSNNFPVNFNTYNLADNSTVRYWGTINQTIRGGFDYGNLDLNNATTKTLGGNIGIDGDLQTRNSTIDASVNNYSINIAGRWDTNNGNSDGSFIARNGTVTFDGSADQILDIGETGTQSFNNILVNKSGGNVEVATSNMVITRNLNVFNGVFDVNNLTVSVGGNMNATGTGSFASGGIGLYLMNASSGTPTIGTNGSVISGSVRINASGRVYELVDDMTLLGNLTITAGTLDVNGQTLSVGNFEDVVNIFGTLNVSTTAKPGGTLALGNDVQLVVQPGGTINIVGTDLNPARVTSNASTDYFFTVTGTPSNKGNIGAKFYVIEYMTIDGIFINANTTINNTNNFSDGTFQNGPAGGRFLRIENNQDLLGANRIENIVFDDNPGGGASNIYKTTSASGSIELFNYTGSFSGENFDEDPNDLIIWLDPPTVTWTGNVSNDWFTAGNWDSGSVPNATQNVIIPQTLNEPIITDNVSVAVANNLTIEFNAIIEINTSDDDIDLQVDGDIVLEESSKLTSVGSNDDIVTGGSWLKLSSALVEPGTSKVTFNSLAGVESIENNNSFYDLEVNIAGSISINNDIFVTNNLNIVSGVFDLGTSDLTIGNDFINSGTINANSQTISLIPTNASSPKVFDPGMSELYSLIIGESAGNDVEYNLSSSLIVDHDLSLITGTLDLNGNNLTAGNDDGSVDEILLAGTLLVESNETVFLGGDVQLLVSSTGDLRFIGTDESNAASLTRRGGGSYDFTIQSGGTFEAGFFNFEHMAGQGIWLQSGSNLVSLNDGVFGNGAAATQYLRLSNAFGADITAQHITFNVGPVSNVRRNEGAGNNIIFEDAAGAFAGPTFEIDDNDPITGEVRWTYTNPLRIWTGTASTNFSDPDNWEDVLGVTPASVPTIANTVQIPDVSAGSNTYPIVDNVSGDANVENITIFSGASLTINDNRSLNSVTDLSNSGTLTISGNGILNIGNGWTNNGIFEPGTSTVNLTPNANVTFSGGASFYNLIIDAAGTGAGIIVSSASLLSVLNDLTITDGTYQTTSASHPITVGGTFEVNETNGSFIDNLSVFTFNGASQNIGTAGGAASISFNDLVIGGTGIKTLLDAININGDLSLESNATFLLGNESITFSGSNFDLDGTFDVDAGVSTVTFNGDQIQVITGTSGSSVMDNVVINNTAAGSNDVQLNIDFRVNDNVDFRTGVVQSSGSNPLTFNDGATVSYDGTEESLPLNLAGTDVDRNSYAVGPVVKIGDDDFIFPIGDGSRTGKLAISSINSSSPTDQFTAEYFLAATPLSGETLNGGIERVSVIEYWDLNRGGSSTGEPRVSLNWDAVSEVTNPATLTVAHYTGASWENEGNGSVLGAAAAGTITSANNFTSFSPITLATTDESDNPLPVELLFFSGKVTEGDVLLEWATATETDNDKFEIERSINGDDFEKIGEVKGQGDSYEVSDYLFNDKSALSGVNYYRLKQMDFNGDFEYSNTVLVDNSRKDISFLAKLYPNPTDQNNINLLVESGNDVIHVNVRIIDASGRVYFQKEFNLDQVRNGLQINPENRISTGVYFVEVRQGDNITQSKLILK